MKWFGAIAVMLALAAPATAAPLASRTAHGVHAEVDRLADGRFALRIVVHPVVPEERRTIVLPRSLHFVSLRLRDFLEDGWPDPLFTFRDGCCLRSWVIDGGDDDLIPYVHRWGPAGFTLRRFGSGSATAFATRAVTFAQAFGRGPVSVAPLRVYTLFDDGHLWTVSTRDPFARPALRHDAARLLAAFHRGVAPHRAAASYAAEECLLGRCEVGYALVRSRFGDGAFLRALRRRLRRRGNDPMRRVTTAAHGMTASVTYADTSIPDVEEHVVVQVRLGGRTLVHRVLTNQNDPLGLRPSRSWNHPAVAITDLDGDGVPQAIFTFDTSSANASPVSLMSSGSALVEHWWYDSNYRIRDLGRDGIPEITTSQAFDYVVARMAPMQVFRLVGARLVDVTRTAIGRPAVAADAQHLRRLHPLWQDPEALTSYAADECSLGHCDRGYALIRRVVRRHRTSYLRHLLSHTRRELRHFGYDRR